MTLPLKDSLTNILGQKPVQLTPLAGGCVADVYRADFENGDSFVVKVGVSGSGLELEGEMLKYLLTHSKLPVPEVFYAADDLLIMAYIEAGGSLTPAAQEQAADFLASLHSVETDCFGFEMDTVIGTLLQPNPWSKNWVEFFREQRLLYMAGEALESGNLPHVLLPQIEKLASDLGRWLSVPTQASLIHGDMWGGNILCKEDHIVGFVDPAIHYGDPEIELAFSTLFHTFSEPFFNRYQETRPISPGFFEERRDIYNLYPLLVHVRLFGGSYVTNVEATLSKFGY